MCPKSNAVLFTKQIINWYQSGLSNDKLCIIWPQRAHSVLLMFLTFLLSVTTSISVLKPKSKIKIVEKYNNNIWYLWSSKIEYPLKKNDINCMIPSNIKKLNK